MIDQGLFCFWVGHFAAPTGWHIFLLSACMLVLSFKTINDDVNGIVCHG